MGQRQREWAKRARQAMIQQLGGKCVDCGTTERLELDHVIPGHWEPRLKDASGRISLYRQEMAAGNLAVRCRSCNAKKSDKMPEATVNEPLPPLQDGEPYPAILYPAESPSLPLIFSS